MFSKQPDGAHCQKKFVKCFVYKIINFRQMSFKGNTMRKIRFLRTLSVYGCVCLNNQTKTKGIHMMHALGSDN